MIKVAEVIGQKIDRLSIRIDEGYGSDIQVVVDRMGDAIRTLSASRDSTWTTSQDLRASPQGPAPSGPARSLTGVGSRPCPS